MQVLILLLVALLGMSQGFVTSRSGPVRAVAMRRFAIDPSDVQGNAGSQMDMDPEDPKLLDMNRLVRLGRSRDQDGKSNIWSIEPRMEVAGEEAGGAKKNLAIIGAVIGAAIISLPLFTAFSSLVPDPTDF